MASRPASEMLEAVHPSRERRGRNLARLGTVSVVRHAAVRVRWRPEVRAMWWVSCRGWRLLVVAILMAAAGCGASQGGDRPGHAEPARGAKGGAHGRAVTGVAQALAAAGALLLTLSMPVALAAAHSPAVGAMQSLRQAWPVSATTAWAWTGNLSGVGEQGISRTTNGGTTWKIVTPPGLRTQGGTHYINGLFALDAEHAWVTYGGPGQINRQTVTATGNGGHTWTVVGSQPDGDSCDLDFATPKIGWCAVITPYLGNETVVLYRTTDDTKHWQVISRTGVGTNPAGSLPYFGDKNIQFDTADVGWTIFAYPASVPPLYQTTDGGKTWTDKHVSKASGALDEGSGFDGQPVVRGKDGAVGYTIDGPAPKSLIYVSTDAGASWHPLTPPGPAEGWLVDCLTPSVWRLVNGTHVLATDNAGKTWSTIDANVSFSLYYAYDSPTPPVVDFVTTRAGWVAGTALWRTVDGGHMWKRMALPGT
jgi:photosystem II stability/assembly factor-like uncharacterized protein